MEDNNIENMDLTSLMQKRENTIANFNTNTESLKSSNNEQKSIINTQINSQDNFGLSGTQEIEYIKKKYNGNNLLERIDSFVALKKENFLTSEANSYLEDIEKSLIHQIYSSREEKKTIPILRLKQILFIIISIPLALVEITIITNFPYNIILGIIVLALWGTAIEKNDEIKEIKKSVKMVDGHSAKIKIIDNHIVSK